ncbi:MAG: hypothetical protein ACRD3D_07150 [Terriglobia bacterium]
MIASCLRRATLALALCLCIAAAAFAQYGGGMPGVGPTGSPTGVYTPPKGGYKSSTGIAIGAAAAAGVGVAYLMLRNHKSVTGCLAESASGTELREGKNGKSLVVDAGNLSLKTGDQVKLTGKMLKTSTGEPEFAARKLVKDYGPCGSQSALVHSPRKPW